MTPEPGYYLSLLMGAPGVSDAELARMDIEVLERFGSAVRGLLVPARSVTPYQELLRAGLKPGFWNDLVGSDQILFLFKLRDGSVLEFTLSEDTREEISRLCSSLNGDPIEKTSDLPEYFACDPFYRDAMVAYYGVRAR